VCIVFDSGHVVAFVKESLVIIKLRTQSETAALKVLETPGHKSE